MALKGLGYDTTLCALRFFRLFAIIYDNMYTCLTHRFNHERAIPSHITLLSHGPRRIQRHCSINARVYRPPVGSQELPHVAGQTRTAEEFPDSSKTLNGDRERDHCCRWNTRSL